MQSAGLPVDKAALIWRKQTLLARAVSLVESACGGCSVLCGTEERCARLKLSSTGIVDRVQGTGPLGGLEAALADSEEHGALWTLVVPVDLPFLTAEMLSAFVARAVALQASAYCLKSEGVTQPLPALVRVDGLPTIREFLLSGGRKVTLALSTVAQRLTPGQGLMALDHMDLGRTVDSRWCFSNINTPQEYQRLQWDETSE